MDILLTGRYNSLVSLTAGGQFKIGIVGFGIVGQALANGFSKDSILYFDKFKNSTPLEDVVSNSDFIFICLPTPMFEDESGIDLSIIEEMVDRVAKLTAGTTKIIVIKSTVVPGTTKKLQNKYPESKFAFNPEFLTEAHYLDDFIHPDRTIIGSFEYGTGERIAQLYRARFPEVPIFLTEPTTAELAKYMSNCYLALKVAFANQVYDIAETLKVDYDEVKKLVVADQRINDTHMDVTAERGFGGKCFPKDLVSIIGLAKDLGVDLSILSSAWDYNKKVRKIHDWNDIPFATSDTQPEKK